MCFLALLLGLCLAVLIVFPSLNLTSTSSSRREECDFISFIARSSTLIVYPDRFFNNISNYNFCKLASSHASVIAIDTLAVSAGQQDTCAIYCSPACSSRWSWLTAILLL